MTQSRVKLHQVLQSVIGLPLWNTGRITDLQWFDFGSRKEYRTPLGRITMSSEFALHVQCPWRIVFDERVVAASDDLYFSAVNPSEGDFDWTKGRSRRDIQIESLLMREARPVVDDLYVGSASSIRLTLRGWGDLEIIPMDSMAHEHYRIINYRDPTNRFHVVVSGEGIELPSS